VDTPTVNYVINPNSLSEYERQSYWARLLLGSHQDGSHLKIGRIDNCLYKLILFEIPPYSIIDFNKSRKHSDPKSFKKDEEDILANIIKVNEHIRHINTSLATHKDGYCPSDFSLSMFLFNHWNPRSVDWPLLNRHRICDSTVDININTLLCRRYIH
jgi:hypothetical protein